MDQRNSRAFNAISILRSAQFLYFFQNEVMEMMFSPFLPINFRVLTMILCMKFLVYIKLDEIIVASFMLKMITDTEEK